MILAKQAKNKNIRAPSASLVLVQKKKSQVHASPLPAYLYKPEVPSQFLQNKVQLK